MNNNIIKSSIISLAITIVVVVLSLAVYHPKTQVISQPSQVVRGTSPEIASQYLIVNGVADWYASNSLNQASTTPCSFLSGSNGTTTLSSFGFNVTTSTSTALVISLATSTNAYSTTTGSTPFATTTIPANTLGSFVWNPSYTTGMRPGMSSTTYVVMGVSGNPQAPSSTNSSIGGSCFAKWAGYN